MQTNFTPEQLRDPAMASSEKILRTCVHCGFCTATCPTYLLLGDELDSPARPHLSDQGHAGGRKAGDAEVVKHIDRCLSCLSCMTTCPSGVNYMHLVDHARSYIEKTYRGPGRPSPALAAGAHPALSRSVSRARCSHARKAVQERAGGAAALRRAPSGDGRTRARRRSRRSASDGPGDFNPKGRGGGGWRSFEGAPSRCWSRASTRRRSGSSTATGSRSSRPGAKVAAARSSIIWAGKRRGSPSPGATSTHGSPRWTGRGSTRSSMTASGCGTTIKDYGFMFREDRGLRGKGRARLRHRPGHHRILH